MKLPLEPAREDPRFEWWRDALAGLAPPAHLDEPQCGFFQRRLVRGGPFVPVAIFWDGPRDDAGALIGDEALRCLVDNVPADPEVEWTWVLAKPITYAEFEFMCRRSRWARVHKPDSPFASPRSRVDLRSVPLPTIPKKRRQET